MIKTVDELTEDESAAAYEPRGATLEVFHCRDREIVISGPAGTGKTRGVLEKLHLVAQKYPKCRILIVRKTRESMTESVLKTFEQDVLPEGSPMTAGADRATRARYDYPNGSEIVVAGMTQGSRNNKAKVMSTEYDIIFVVEATELTETDWENLISRLRNGRLPYEQIIGDCNPDAPTHWLKKRADREQARLFYSKHVDNARMYDARADRWTDYGAKYMRTLAALTGIRRKRLLEGLWVQAENAVFEYDESVHLIDRFPIPPTWRRYWSIDFGFNNPFVWQDWAMDDDDTLYRVHEVYVTRKKIKPLAQAIKAFVESPAYGGPSRPKTIICDHDRAARNQLEEELGFPTVAAYKDVETGINAVNDRLAVQPNGRARLYFLRNSIRKKDPRLVEAKLPTCTEEEIGAYVWDELKESPVKENDHGCDATRYQVAHHDLRPRTGTKTKHFRR